MLDSKKEASCPQTHNCLLTGYWAPRAPSASWDPIPGLVRYWVQIFETPTVSTMNYYSLVPSHLSFESQKDLSYIQQYRLTES